MRGQGHGIVPVGRSMVVAMGIALALAAPVSAGGAATMVKDINPDGSSDPYDPHRLGTRFVFGAKTTDDALAQLYRSNGTGNGTKAVRLPFPDDIQDLVVVGETLYFNAETASKGQELWRSDATELGTRVLRDIWPGAEGGKPDDIARLGRIILFRAGHPQTGRELWRSNGTQNGTRLVKDINPAGDATHGAELWRFDP